jgi:hypothetical protein
MEAHMNLLDEKGRLFGKLNIVDFLVILLIVVVAVVLAVKFSGSDSIDAESGETVTLTYTVRVAGVDQATYENVCQFVDSSAGLKDQLMASGDMLNGYIVDVAASTHIQTAADTVGGDTLDLLFTIVAEVSDVTTGTVGTQEVRIGKSHIVKSTHIEFTGTIMTCQWAS